MDVLEELTEFEQHIDKTHVEKRVEDWAKRIDDLYEQIERWLPVGWRADISDHVTMHEPLMQAYGVCLRELPVLSLLQGDEPAGTLVPRGLWIIGANGRIDLLVGADRFVIVDAAENFERPHWRISPFFARRDETDLTSLSLLAILT